MKRIILLLYLFPFFCFTQVISLVDKYTNEKVNYEKTDYWADGSKISDNKTDGVIYVKNGDSYYKRLYYGAVNVKWFGAKGDNTTNDTRAFQKALYFLKNSITSSQLKPNILFVPRGDYIIDQIVWDYDGFQMEGEGPTATMFKFTNKMQNAEAGIYPANREIDTQKKGFTFYTNVSIKEIGCDPSTIGIGKSFILIRNTYNFLLRNVSLLNDTFDENKYALMIKDNSYTGSVENCDLPRIYFDARNPWTITTINLINLRTTFIHLKNSLGISFLQPVIQGKRSKKVIVENCNTISLMNGDVEDEGSYLCFVGNNSNIRSYGNNILALKGKYTEGVVPNQSFFDDRGYVGIGDVNENGKFGKVYIKNAETEISHSVLSENRSTILIEGNINSEKNKKYTYTSSDNGIKTWGNLSDDFKDYQETIRLMPNGNLLIGTKEDTGQKLQINGGLKLKLPTIDANGNPTNKPSGYLILNVNNEEVKIPYYK